MRTKRYIHAEFYMFRGPQEGIFGFKWGVHVGLDGVDGKYLMDELGHCERLEIARSWVRPENMANFVTDIKDGNGPKPRAVIKGWMCDSTTVPWEAREYVRVCGWESGAILKSSSEETEQTRVDGLLEDDLQKSEKTEIGVSLNLEL
jgi:hypothetical protein